MRSVRQMSVRCVGMGIQIVRPESGGGSATPWLLIVGLIVGALVFMCLVACGFGLYCCIKRGKANRAAAATHLANSPEQKRLVELAD